MRSSIRPPGGAALHVCEPRPNPSTVIVAVRDPEFERALLISRVMPVALAASRIHLALDERLMSPNRKNAIAMKNTLFDPAKPRTVPDRTTVRERLDVHFMKWLGAIPDRARPRLVVTERRDEPGWDGKIRPIQGVSGPDGIVLAVSPRHAGMFDGVELIALFRDAGQPDAQRRLRECLGQPVAFGMPIFRWSERAADLEDAGTWIDPVDRRTPEWLRPFNGGVLVSLDDEGRYQAGVGLKRHNDLAQEISVTTEPDHRGQGLATRLVAQAARRVIEEGSVPIYQHADGNQGSGRVADAAGFPDRGWHMLEIHPGEPGDIRG